MNRIDLAWFTRLGVMIQELKEYPRLAKDESEEEVPTSAAFHLFRATESVLRRYYGVVVGALPKVKMRNWGAYLKYLKKCNADPKILSALEQIKDLHRNPVLHPETRIDIEEALSLVGMVESLIGAMTADMKKRDAAKEAAAALPQLDLKVNTLLQGATE